jgi:hypothetical protein
MSSTEEAQAIVRKTYIEMTFDGLNSMKHHQKFEEVQQTFTKLYFQLEELNTMKGETNE